MNGFITESWVGALGRFDWEVDGCHWLPHTPTVACMAWRRKLVPTGLGAGVGVRRQLEEVRLLLAEWTQAPGLPLRGNKCVVTPNVGPHGPYVAELCNYNMSGSFRAEGQAMYVGFEEVQDALQHQWDAVTARVVRRVEGVLFPPGVANTCIVVQYAYCYSGAIQVTARGYDSGCHSGNHALCSALCEGALP